MVPIRAGAQSGHLEQSLPLALVEVAADEEGAVGVHALEAPARLAVPAAARVPVVRPHEVQAATVLLAPGTDVGAVAWAKADKDEKSKTGEA